MAASCVSALENRVVIDELCRRWVENPNPELESIIRKGNYAPDEVSTRALFYFLLGEWQKYEDLDFDHSLLAKAYQSASQETRMQVSAKAKAEGRIEWIKVLTNINFGFNIEQMTDKDWELSIDILVSYLDRKEIWKFLYDSPIIWSKHLLKKLSKISFKWFNKNEEAILKKLFNLVETIENSDFVSSSLYSQIRESTITSFVNSSNYCDKRDSQWKSLVITPDSQVLISSFYDRICFWNLSDGSLLKTLEGYTNEKYCTPSHALSLAVSPNGQVLASCKLNCAGIKLHSLPDGNLLRTIHTYDHRVNSLVISSDSKILISGGDKLVLWDLSSGTSIRTLNYSYINALAISPDDNILVIGSDGGINLCSLPDGNTLKTLQYGLSQRGYLREPTKCRSLVITPDNRLLVSMSLDGASSYVNIDLWSLPEGNHIKTLINEYYRYSWGNSLTISPDGQLLAFGQRRISLWSLPEGNCMKILNSGGCGLLPSSAITPNGQMLACNGYDNNIYLWSLSYGNCTLNKFTPENISEIESNIMNTNLREGIRNALKFTLTLIRLRQQFDIDIEDVSSDIQF
ncbi:hypothetical protein MEN41_20570, partial [Dolichospermum sp. ST_con]|nr:hypothetical protein [Dolichospermum sp. ST_con]